MNKKVLSVFLALLLMIPNFAFADNADPVSIGEALGGRAAQTGSETTVASTRALEALLYQANGKLQDDDSVEVIVSFRPDAFSNLGQEVAASALYQGDNISRQQSLGENIVEEGLRRIENEVGDISTIFEYHVLFFGFSSEITFAQAKAIAQLDYVDFVEIATQRMKPTLKNPMSVMTKNANEIKLRSALRPPFDVREIVGSSGLYANNKGEGTLIAIIDSGYDMKHKSFYLSDDSTGKLTKAEVEALISSGELKGHYFSAKIPFAYNYREFNNKMKEANAHSHGQHVAGIAAGNVVKFKSGDDDAIFAGIAPEAQLALMRVFKDGNPGTSATYYAKALDDAAILKADSANMSLGAPAGDYRTLDKHTKDALTKLKEAGCVVAIAAGNETAFGNDLGLLPDASNPDYGILGTPAIEENSLAVASLQNDAVTQPFFNILPSKDASKGEMFAIQWQRTTAKFKEDEVYEYVFVELGKPEDVKDVDLTGKYALIERGEINFSSKVENAVSKGAVGVIIFNSAAGGDSTFGMAGVDKATVPVAAITRTVGLKLKEKQQWLKFSKNVGTFDSKTAGYISDFSSFGLTADGDFKPDITAPGGNIYSLANDQEFISNSGTSMASPQVAGGIALVRKRVAQDFPQLTQAEQWQLVRNLLMSTAKVHYHPETGAASTPRQQGAGIMWLDGALNSNVVLIGDKGESKILRPNASDKEMLKFVVKNYSDEEKTFSYYGEAVTDDVKNGKFTLRPHDLGLDIEAGSVTVPAKGESTVEIMLDSSSQTAELKQRMPNGYFVDGFIMLDGEDENLSIPFVTFIGGEKGLEGVDFVEAPIYDLVKAGRLPFYYKSDVQQHFGQMRNVDYTHLFVELGKDSEILGAVHGFDFANPKFEKQLVISPNNDEMADKAGLLFVMLRNGFAESAVYQLDKDNKKIEASKETLMKKKDVIKNYGSSDPNAFNSNFGNYWPTPTTKNIKEGNYVFVLKNWGTKGDTQPGKDIEIPFTVDLGNPEVKNGKFDEATRTLSFEASDKQTAVKFIEVSYGQGKDRKFIEPIAGSTSYIIPDGVELKNVDIVVWDLGYNKFVLNGEIARDVDKIGKVKVNLDWQSKPDAYKPKYEIKSQDPTDKKIYDPNFLPFGKYVLELKKPYAKDYVVHDQDKFDANNNVYRYEFEISEQQKEATVSIKIQRIYRIEIEVKAFKTKDQKDEAAFKKLYGNIESVKVVSKADGSEKDLKFKYNSILGFLGYSVFTYGDYDVVVKLKDNSPYKMRVYRQFESNGTDEMFELGEYKDSFPVTINDDSKLTKDGDIEFYIELFESGVDKSELTKLVDDVDNVKDSENYKNATSDKRKAYDEAIAAGILVLDDKSATQEKVNEAVKAIKNALAELKPNNPTPPVNTKELEDLVKEQAEVHKTDNYQKAAEDAKKAYDEAIVQGQELLNNPPTDQKVIDDAVAAIKKAKENLKPNSSNPDVDKKELQDLVNQKDVVKSDPKYQAASDELKKAYDDAIEKAEELLSDVNATQNQVNDAVNAIKVAIQKIELYVPKFADKSQLKKLLDNQDAIKNDPKYQAASETDRKAYDDAIAEGQKIFDQADATQDDVDKAVKAILDAIDKISIDKPQIQAKKEHLKKLLESAATVRDKDLYKYADGTKKQAYDDAITSGNEIYDKPDATQDEVDVAVKAIEDALNALDGVAPKQQPPTPPTPPSSGGGGGFGGGSGGGSSVRPGSTTTTTIPENPTPLAQPAFLASLTIGSKEYKVFENGKEVSKMMDVAPMIHKGRTMLPARVIAELLGIEVKYDDSTKTAKFVFVKEEDGKKHENIVELTLGKNMMKVNGKEQALSGEIINVGGRVLLPMTDVQKALKELGLKIDVKWDNATKTVTLEQMK